MGHNFIQRLKYLFNPKSLYIESNKVEKEESVVEKVENKAENKILLQKLPAGWNLYEASQDLLFGCYTVQMIKPENVDSEGGALEPLCVTSEEKPTFESAWDECLLKIKNKKYD